MVSLYGEPKIQVEEEVIRKIKTTARDSFSKLQSLINDQKFGTIDPVRDFRRPGCMTRPMRQRLDDTLAIIEPLAAMEIPKKPAPSVDNLPVLPPSLIAPEEQAAQKRARDPDFMTKDFLGESVPKEDKDDKWFAQEFKVLFKLVEGFAGKFFEFQYSVMPEAKFSPWVKMSKEFVNYAGMTAGTDPEDGGWDALLLEPEQRKWLVAGIMNRILDVRVLQEDLFGASETQKEMLLLNEKALVGLEGFARTAHRANSTRVLLGNQLIPLNFFREVTILTKRIELLFLPLFLHLTSLPLRPSAPEGYRNPSVSELNTGIQALITYAVRLHVHIRLSPTILYTVWDRPNDPFSDTDHSSLGLRFYQSSKAHHIKRMPVLPPITDVPNGLSGTTRNPDGSLRKTPEQAKQEAAEVRRKNPVRRALVKFAVAPRVDRYKAGNGRDDGDEDGFRVAELLRSQVVCYYGYDNAKVREELGYNEMLSEHLQEAKFRVWENWVVKTLTLASLGTVVGGAVAWKYGAVDYIKERIAAGDLRGQLGDLKEATLDELLRWLKDNFHSVMERVEEYRARGEIDL